MVEQVKGIEEIQSEHRKWESDHSEWQAAIDEWRQDHKKFVEDLSRARTAVEEYRFVLETHANAVAAHNSRLEAYAHSLKQNEEAEVGGGMRSLSSRSTATTRPSTTDWGACTSASVSITKLSKRPWRSSRLPPRPLDRPEHPFDKLAG